MSSAWRQGTGRGNVALCSAVCIVHPRYRPERTRCKCRSLDFARDDGQGVIPSERSESRNLHLVFHVTVEAMRIVMMVAGVLLLFVGCVWILQGINVLPG